MTDQTNQRGWLARINQPQAALPWSLFDVGSSWVVMFLATAMLGPAIVFPSGGQVTPTILLLGWLIGQGIVLAYLFITLRRKPESFKSLQLTQTTQSTPFLLLIGAGLMLTLDVIGGLGTGQFLPAPELIGVANAAPLDWVLAILLMILIQPIAEEIVFRGLTLPKLREVLGGRNGWLASALIFALFHFLIFGVSLSGGVAFWFAFILPLLMGLFLGAVRIITGSTRAVIIMRMGVGLFALLAAFVLAG